MKLSYSLTCMSRTQNVKKDSFLIGCISSSLDYFPYITKEVHKSFPACQTLHDNFLINEIGDTQFYCMQT